MKRTLTCLIVVAAILLAPFVLLALPVGLYVLSGLRLMGTRDRTMLTLPDGTHAIEHSRILTHGLVAEYSRNVTYITGKVRGKTTPLYKDTCGGYPINCYVIETPRGPLLRFDDAVAEHLLDMTTQTTYMVTRVLGTPYIGELTDERVSSGWSMRNNDPSTLSVTIGGVEAKPMAELTQNAPEVYLGRFSGGAGHLHFTPASESPEIAIDHLFDRRKKGDDVVRPGIRDGVRYE